MLSFEPNIIVVDDKKDEIQGILDQYINQGIGCKFYNADYTSGDEKPGLPYADVNLIFLDLLYSNRDFDAEQCSNWIRTLIPEKSFYVLIIWTKDPAHAEDVMIELRKDHINRLPFKLLVKNKVDFPTDSESKFDYTKLFHEIDEEMKNISSLDEIGIWKKSIKGASNIVVGNLSKNSDPEIFNAKLQKVIVAHGGTSLLESDNSIFKRRILFDALDQVLISNTRNSIPSEEIDQINKDQLYSLSSAVSAETDKELNSWFHFKLQDNIPKDSILPGLICQNKHSLFIQLYSILDDPKLERKLLKQVEHVDTKIEDIVLVLSRPCDIAQNKYGKNIKLLSGLKISNPKRVTEEDLTDKQKKDKKRYLGKLHFNNEELPDSVKLFDKLHFDDRDSDVIIMFDYRYVFSVPEKIFIDKFDNLKIFNKELLSEMQVEYSSYSSRLGITQII